jgi:putative glutamine amidotransferase
MTTRPLIGVTTYYISADEGYGGRIRDAVGQAFSLVSEDYLKSIERAGGVPIGLSLLSDDALAAVVERLDGILLTGGEDVDPKRYGETVDYRFGRLSLERDEFEFRLIAAALASGKPILAICRGLQILNVYFGGTLYKDVEDFGSALTHNFDRNPRWYTSHKVKLLHPVLKQLYDSDVIETNSYHHQSVKDVAVDLEVAAVAPDGVVEALVHKQLPQVLALQWHPEMMSVRYDSGLTPFCWLIETARNARQL